MSFIAIDYGTRDTNNNNDNKKKMVMKQLFSDSHASKESDRTLKLEARHINASSHIHLLQHTITNS